MTLRPGIPLRREKGQPEGSAVTGKTRKLRVAEMGLVSKDAAGQNNSNLTSLTALVVNGGWELLLAKSSHYCFIYHSKICRDVACNVPTTFYIRI
jgi:hypothetical protein